jgi:hypothetical protein
MGSGMMGRGMGKVEVRIIPLPNIPLSKIGLRSLLSLPLSPRLRLVDLRFSRGLVGTPLREYENI